MRQSRMRAAAIPALRRHEDVVQAAIGLQKGQPRGVGIGPDPGPARLARVTARPGILVHDPLALERASDHTASESRPTPVGR